MGVRICMRLVAITLLTLVGLVSVASADQNRPGRLITLDNREIVFDSITERDTVKGWWNGSALTVPMKTVSEVTFFEAPKVDYSIIGNDIKTGTMGLTRASDGKQFVLQDAFMPADCNCSYITYTYKNPFTGETLQANAAIDGLQRIVFEDGAR
ncbi:MAG: hypothetical protein GWO30_00555 [Gammaproteobacteria bacterium]|nr:hypothetical protein [Gammaproteobacteria bacterium]NIR50568.1 hypothetical protein [candidate division KSB1 bacterium]NIV69852.1 hypothetical protein [Phycisphaerae bacterium]NIQ08711.1 hypothetical protein [Gammaproteobacteria bacterium]NIS26063.1 hypothetical protein [candidate division KSB1 bacterium]